MAAAALLFQAYRYAQDAHIDQWQFSLTADQLSPATVSDLRWLIARRYARHSEEITTTEDSERRFRPLSSLMLPRNACLILSDEGADFLGKFTDHVRISVKPCSLSEAGPAVPLADSMDGNSATASTSLKVPAWNKDLRELRFGTVLVKIFRVPASNQELILSAFEEEGWPSHIDDPLPETGSDPIRRLQSTIKSLNRHQLSPLISFYGNGHGRTVCWRVAVNRVKTSRSRPS